MADNKKNDKKQDKKQDKKSAPKADKQEKKPKGEKAKRTAEPAKEHTGVGLAVPDVRLRTHYQTVVRAALTKQFGLTNVHQIPNLTKIVLNVGLGEAIKQPKLLDSVVDELGIITGQRAVRKKAKKSIANYGLRQGQRNRGIGDAARCADVGVPRPVHHGRGPADPRFPRARRARSMAAATTAWASKSR